MTEAARKQTQTFTVTNELGFHLRPASMLAQAARRFSSSVTVIKGDQQVDAKSILAIVSLAAVKGDSVRVVVEGNDAEEAMTMIGELFANDFRIG